MSTFSRRLKLTIAPLSLTETSEKELALRLGINENQTRCKRWLQIANEHADIQSCAAGVMLTDKAEDIASWSVSLKIVLLSNVPVLKAAAFLLALRKCLKGHSFVWPIE